MALDTTASPSALARLARDYATFFRAARAPEATLVTLTHQEAS